MLKAQRGFTIVQRIVSTDTLKEIQSDKPNKGVVYDAGGTDVYKKGDIVFYIPHSELEIELDGDKYYAVPTGDIVALISNDKPGE